MKQILSSMLVLAPMSSVAVDFHIPVDETELSYETVTNLRSSYIHRGIELAETTLDFQFNGFLSYGEGRFLEYGAWYATEADSGVFTELGLSTRYLEKILDWSYFVGAQYKSVSNSDIIDSGFELDVGVIYEINNDQEVSLIISYDTAAKGWYSSVDYTYFKDIDTKSYISFKAGLSLTEQYYESSGFNDVHAKVAYTYNLTDLISVSPYISTSITSDQARFFGGVGFEVSF